MIQGVETYIFSVIEFIEDGLPKKLEDVSFITNNPDKIHVLIKSHSKCRFDEGIIGTEGGGYLIRSIGDLRDYRRYSLERRIKCGGISLFD